MAPLPVSVRVSLFLAGGFHPLATKNTLLYELLERTTEACQGDVVASVLELGLNLGNCLGLLEKALISKFVDAALWPGGLLLGLVWRGFRLGLGWGRWLLGGRARKKILEDFLECNAGAQGP